MEIKNEELDISEDESKFFDVIHQNNPVVVTNTHDGCTYNIGKDNNKVYSSLKSVDFQRFKGPGRLLTPLIKSSTEHIGNSCPRSNGYKSPSPKKLGEKTFGRSYNIIKSSRKKLNIDVNQEELNLDNVEKVIENKENVECSEIITPEPYTSPLPKSNNRNCESDDDIFASQEIEKRNEIINNINIENVSQQLTPLKETKEKLNDATAKDEKLFPTPQSIGHRSINSDSESDRFCNAINSNNFSLKHYGFEAMDLLNEFDDLIDDANNKILSKVLGLSVNNGEDENEPLTDPLAQTPQKVNDAQQGNNESPLQNPTRKRKLSSYERRRSIRHKEKLVNVSRESDLPFVDEELKKVREKIKEVEKKEAISPMTIEKLKKLDIQLENEPPPQHQLETCISRPPLLNIKKAFVQYGPMKRGSFSEAEDKIIKANWARFCSIHNWDPKNLEPFINVRIRHKNIFSSKQRIKFVRFIAQGLPWRLLYSVYLRFQTIYAKNERDGKYSSEEDAQILVYMEKEAKQSRNCMKLAKVLNRSQGSVWARYLYLKNQKRKQEKKTKIEWNVPLIEKFLKHLLKVTLSEDIYELKDAVIPKVVWIELERKLKIPHEAMIFFWLYRLHAQLFCIRPIYEVDTKIMLIEYMYVKGVSNKQELIWPSIARHFDGLTPHYLSRQFRILVKSAPRNRRKNLAGVINWLYEKKIPQLATKINDRCLPRLIYKNGKIETIEEFLSTSASSSSSDSSDCN